MIVTATPIVSGAWVKILRVRDKRQNRKAEMQSRNWNFIAPETINDWFVRLSEEPPTPEAKVVLQVTRSDGSADERMAENMHVTPSSTRSATRTPGS